MNKTKRIILILFAFSVMLNLAISFFFCKKYLSDGSSGIIDDQTITELDMAENSLESAQDTTDLTQIENYVELVQGDSESIATKSETEISSSSTELDKKEKYELRNTIVYDQLFYGTWLIEDFIAPNLMIPTSYTRLDEEGNFIGILYSTILGQEITFDYDYVEYSGEKREYLYGPLTYTHALLSEDQSIARNYAKSLNLTGDFYSIIYYVAEDYDWSRVKPGEPIEMYIGNLRYLYPKDNDTMYASDGVYTYLLTRVKDN